MLPVSRSFPRTEKWTATAGRFGVEMLNGKTTVAGLQLHGVAYTPVESGSSFVAERRRLATVDQRLQRLNLLMTVLRTFDREPRLVPKYQR